MQNRFGRFDTTSSQEIMLSSGVFRRETASGFYPWGNVVSHRERVAEGLCGWRHGNSFPMTQSRTIPLPNAKHSTLLQGCFLCFCFFIPLTIRQQSIIYPHIFSTDPLKPHLYRCYSIGIGGWIGEKASPNPARKIGAVWGMDVRGNRGYLRVTRVPHGSPASTLRRLPFTSMLNTWIGSPFSLHMIVAVISITLRLRL